MSTKAAHTHLSRASGLALHRGRYRTLHLGEPKCSRNPSWHFHTGHCADARVTWKQDGHVGGQLYGAGEYMETLSAICVMFSVNSELF